MPNQRWPFIGRQVELGQIRHALEDQWLSGIVIVGPGGAGKSRLAAEACAAAAAAGEEVDRVVATRSSRRIPFGALAPLLPELGDRTPNIFALATETIAARGGDRPMVLHVDDAHLLDERSATLIHQLVLSNTIFAVVTVRSGEPCEDAITALWKDGLASRLEVGLFDEEDTALLAAEVLRGSFARPDLAELHELTEGNALAVCELLRGAREEGTLVHGPDGWHFADGVRVPGRLVDLIGNRLDALDEDEYAVLELVALAEPVGVDALIRLVPRDSIDRIERAGMVEVRDDGRRLAVWSAHPLHAQIVRDRMPALRRRQVLTSLVDLFETMTRRRGDIMRRASWKLDLNMTSDPDLFETAARQAFVAMDLTQTARLATVAWETRPTVAAGHLLGHVLSELGDTERADETLAKAAPLADDDRSRSNVALTRSENLFRMDRAAEAYAVLDEADATVADPDCRAELVGHRATLVMLEGDLRAARTLIEPMLATSGRPFVEAAIVAGITFPFSGKPSQAAAISESALVQHQQIWDAELTQSHPSVHYWGILSAHIHLGQLDQAQELADGMAEALRSMRLDGHLAWLDIFFAQIELYRGLLVSAAQRFRLVEQTCIPHRRRIPLCSLYLAWAQHGDIARATAAGQELEGLGVKHLGLLRPVDDLARGWIAAHTGDVEGARRAFVRGAEAAADTGHERFAALGWFHLARTGHPGHAEVAAAGMEALRPVLEGPQLSAEADFTLARAADDPIALEEVGARFERMGSWLAAAESYGAATAAQTDRRHARGLALRARLMAERCEGTPAPLLRGLASAVDLTPREREVGRLAADGLTARDIGDRLHLSKRTVENHLQRAYEKLGIRGRGELEATMAVLRADDEPDPSGGGQDPDLP